MNTLVTIDEFGAAWRTDRKKFEKLVKDTIKKRWGYELQQDDLHDLVGDAMMKMLEKMHEGSISFTRVQDCFAYIMRSCLWNNTRNHTKKGLDFVDVELEKLSLMHTDTVELTHADEADHQLQQVWQKLEESIGGDLTFRDVSLFRSFVLNSHSLKSLIAESGLCKTTCQLALKRVREYLQGIVVR